MPRSVRLVTDVADILGIEDLLDRRPKQLSGGQRQRVAVGRAIVRQPSVFLFDEPLSNLDAKLRVQMRAEILKLQHRLQTTTIYVTHDQVEAMTMGRRIAVLNQGVLQQIGTPLEVYEQPTNRFVASFIGTPPMNFLSATVSGDGLRLDGPGLALPCLRRSSASRPAGAAAPSSSVCGPSTSSKRRARAGPTGPRVEARRDRRTAGHAPMLHGRIAGAPVAAKLIHTALPARGRLSSSRWTPPRCISSTPAPRRGWSPDSERSTL